MNSSVPASDLTDPALCERLAAWIAGVAGAREARITDLRRLAGGSSREIWALRVALVGSAQSRDYDLVLRRDPPGRADEGSRDLEFRVVRRAQRAGVPVPAVHWCCTDPTVLGTSFYLMDRVEGEALPRRLLRDERYRKAREAMTGQLAEIAAAIHRIDPDDPELAGLPDASREGSPARVELEQATEALRALAPEPHPVLELAARWLSRRLPPPGRRALVHGDFRVGNVLFDESGARAILDWELCKIGDPVEDLGWLCTRAWRFGNDSLPVGGIGSREELLETYAKASGQPVDPQHLLFWEALGSFKVALVFIRQAWVYLSGRLPSLELASLGRRTVEAEDELLRLMEEEG